MKYTVFSLMIGLLLVTCQASEEAPQEPAPEKETLKVTHYYSVKMEEDTPVRDTIKECFSCNQAEVYNDEGKLLALRFYKANMKDLYGYEIYTYNDQGKRNGSNYYENDTLVSKYRYDLDAVGRIATGKAFDTTSEEMLYGYVNAYDEAGNHISTGSMNAKGEVYEYYKRSFNENGIATIENITDLEGNPTFQVKYEYRPQADSNWVEQLTYYNGKLSEIRFREEVILEK